MGFAPGCLLSWAAILTSLLVASEQEVLEQRLGSGPINMGRNRRSAAGRSAAGLDLDRERRAGSKAARRASCRVRPAPAPGRCRRWGARVTGPHVARDRPGKLT